MIAFELDCHYIGETLELEIDKKYSCFISEPPNGPINITVFDDDDNVVVNKDFDLDERNDFSIFFKENFVVIEDYENIGEEASLVDFIDNKKEKLSISIDQDVNNTLEQLAINKSKLINKLLKKYLESIKK